MSQRGGGFSPQCRGEGRSKGRQGRRAPPRSCEAPYHHWMPRSSRETHVVVGGANPNRIESPVPAQPEGWANLVRERLQRRPRGLHPVPEGGGPRRQAEKETISIA